MGCSFQVLRAVQHMCNRKLNEHGCMLRVLTRTYDIKVINIPLSDKRITATQCNKLKQGGRWCTMWAEVRVNNDPYVLMPEVNDGTLQRRCQHRARRALLTLEYLTVVSLLSSTRCGAEYDFSGYDPMADATVVPLQGQLLYRTTHPNGTWVLSVDMDNTYKLPRQPVNSELGVAVSPGLRIALVLCGFFEQLAVVPVGSEVAPTLLFVVLGFVIRIPANCVASKQSANTCVDITDVRMAAAGLPVLSATNQTIRLLVIVLSLNATSSCGAQRGASVEDVRNAFLSPGGYADFLGNCSYGKMVLDRQALTVVPQTGLCSQLIMSCNVDYISTVSRRRIPKAAMNVPSPVYTHLAYVLPNGTLQACQWSGLSELPGKQSWFADHPQVMTIARVAG
ncbi:hypothetical protein VOLCADRAFT_91812 [Volvox carteri f. nagariensis]|uniref:Peptidase M11 gametolysin domain-containing protein n=1 Tax=Volvox carteri f. nagariensis TaxID=3068 RepID=D8TY08_VOLCA|nr:uncharacterized protein VOLCADRAFT_91812 [Volvox carteri f. nagariensis]EFJ47467.1 hypothetical protein VOLCADRAFT_91812 [Volvox carteri f. nagariensis]|eukprot:XP_002951291.1 hypothetical protein VOLCADRAFT_91812 [Volvox carteri f. nagariensis]